MVHGFSSSPKEMTPLRKALEKGYPSLYCKQITLAGHGQDYMAFQNSTNVQWVNSVVDAVNTTDINVVIGASAGGTAILNAWLSGRLPNNVVIIVIDPFLKPTHFSFHSPHAYTFFRPYCSSAH